MPNFIETGKHYLNGEGDIVRVERNPRTGQFLAVVVQQPVKRCGSPSRYAVDSDGAIDPNRPNRYDLLQEVEWSPAPVKNLTPIYCRRP